jgi:hypothetical protein
LHASKELLSVCVSLKAVCVSCVLVCWKNSCYLEGHREGEGVFSIGPLDRLSSVSTIDGHPVSV